MPTKKELETENELLKKMIAGLGGDPTLPLESHIQIGDCLYPKSVPVELLWEGEYAEFKRDDSWYFEEHGDAIRRILDAWNIEHEDHLAEFVVYGGTHWEDSRTGIQAKISKCWESLEILIAECKVDEIELADRLSLKLPNGTMSIVDPCFSRKQIGAPSQSKHSKPTTTALVSVASGNFTRVPDSDDLLSRDVSPHKIQITKDFYVGKYPVTQQLWYSVMGTKPADCEGENLPVENVSWLDCIKFCNKLSEMEDLALVYQIKGKNVLCDWEAKGYRLLTEAEWEYCAKGREEHRYSGSDSVDEVGWYEGNADYETHPVGQKKPNAFGLYDMTGNVEEWCWDWYGRYISDSQSQDPVGQADGSKRVSRGGSWIETAKKSRLSNRNCYQPTDKRSYIGFRIMRIS